MEKMLQVKNLEISYGDVKVVWGVDFFVHQNEIVGIIGSNGAGKTTILSAIAGLLPIDNGEIIFKGEKIENISIQERVKKGIMLVPEGAGVFPNMNVYDNLLMGAYIIPSERKKKQLLENIFSIFPILYEKQNHLAKNLSGGERQILSVARGLMANPLLILLDEPTLGLQPKSQKKILNIILELKKDGKTILLVEQNISSSLKICDRSYIIENGKIVLSGSCNDLKKNDFIKKAYLGI